MATLYGTKLVETATVVNETTLPEDGDFSQLCRTYKNSVELKDEDPQIEEEFCDQSSAPIAVFSEPGKSSIKFQGFEFDNDTLQKLFGGSVESGYWVEGDNLGKEVAFRIKTDSGHIISYPKGKLIAKKNISLLKNKVALIDLEFKPLSKCHIKNP